eukprot:scaffold918_cov168-Ochromonas_danica.AAC.7
MKSAASERELNNKPNSKLEKRKRAFSGEEAGTNIATLRFSTKNLSRSNADGEIVDTRTCFFAGRGTLKLKNDDHSVKRVWISARHAGDGQPLKAGTTASLYMSASQANVPAVCVFDCIESDIAFLVSDVVPFNVIAHNFGTAHLHEHVFAAGFGTASDIGDGNPTICEGMVCREKADKAMKFDAEGVEYRCNRFFMVQMVADHGFSGGPVYNSFGYVLGMLCAGEMNGLPITYVLKASHLEDNLQDVFDMKHYFK